MSSRAAASPVREDLNAPAFTDHGPSVEDFLSAVLAGLTSRRKSIPCRFLYDETGSGLFDRICDLPEYYPTRTETRILRDNATRIAAVVGSGAQLVELGSGASEKVRILLEALDEPAAYVPIDISAAHLFEAASRIQADYPAVSVHAICADYSQPFDLPPSGRGRRAGFYPGSTIGNMTPQQAQAFLALWAERLGPGAAMIVGVDLRKDATILEPAYDDAEGVTAAFSLNLLARANRELDADFDLTGFEHQVRYLPSEGRVAIHLRSLRSQVVTVAGRTFTFAAGELLHVEDSWKYTPEGFAALAGLSGFTSAGVFFDDDGLFSVHLLETPDRPTAPASPSTAPAGGETS
jgi:dimethylhistidine N-methyltransferase